MKKSTIYSLTRRFVFLLSVIGATCVVAFSQATYQEALASLKTNRDRLLNSYASHKGYADRYQAWASMTESQKGVFLTLTDLLGRRTFTNYNGNYIAYYQPDYLDEIGGCLQLNQQFSSYPYVGPEGVYHVPTDGFDPNQYSHTSPNPYEVCELTDAAGCVWSGDCAKEELPRTDWDMALNHVTELYAIPDSGGSCYGDGNRMFFGADLILIDKFRNLYTGIPEWGPTSDPGGPHPPFTQTRETNGGLFGGYPHGQSQEWAWNYQASYLTRDGIMFYDPQVIEMDIDYTAAGHPSNPECYYGGTLGRWVYQNRWWNFGLGGSADYSYSPY